MLTTAQTNGHLSAAHLDAYRVLQLLHPKTHPGTALFPYATKQAKLFSELIRHIDTELTKATQHKRSFVYEVTSAEKTQKAMTQTVTLIAEQLVRNSATHCISMIMGTTPMLNQLYQQLKKNPAALLRIHPIRVVRSQGMGMGTSELVTPIHVPTDAPIIIHDDIIDTGAAALVTLLAIKKLRGDSENNEALLKTVEYAGKNGKKFTDHDLAPAYTEFAELLYQENCVIAVPFYKNVGFLHSLKTKITTAQNIAWATLQAILLKHILIFEQEQWVMGGGTDTGFMWEKDILPILPTEWVQSQNGLLSNLNGSMLRIGSTIPGIIALKEGMGSTFFEWVQRQIINTIASG